MSKNKGVLDRIAKFFGGGEAPTQPMFKAMGDYWFSAWTNNFEDRDGEIFASRAIDGYIRRVDAKVVPLPELWLWHTPGTKCGRALFVDRVGAFAVAMGKFDDSTWGKAAKAFFNQRDAEFGVSHGFAYQDRYKVGNVYHQFNTFEISPLPADVAANPYCTFTELETMEMKAKNLEWLKKINPEGAAELVERLEEKSTALRDLVAYKAYLSDEDEELKMDETPEVMEAVENLEQNAMTLLPELIADITTVSEMLGDAVEKMRKMSEEQDDAKRKMEEGDEELREELEKARKEIRTIKQQLDARPRQASKASETVVDEKDVSAEVKRGIEEPDPFYPKARKSI